MGWLRRRQPRHAPTSPASTAHWPPVPTELRPASAIIQMMNDDDTQELTAMTTTDAGRHTPESTNPQLDDRPTCEHCRGTGRQLSTNDLLHEMLGFLPTDDAVAMDEFVAEFYRRFLAEDAEKSPADRVAELFPADLVAASHDALDSAGKQQRDKLLTGVVQVLSDYDPEHPESEQMRRLNVALGAYGRDHAAFLRPDGTVRAATPDEYLQVRDVLHQMLREVVHGAWRREYTRVYLAAYHHAMTEMMYAAQHATTLSGAPFVEPRQPRESR